MSTLQQPTHIGRYRIGGVLGHGGMGVVYLGFDPGLGRRVAVKTVRKALQAGPCWDPVERFRREARAAARLSHPHVVTVHELCEDEHSAYLVCEHVAGASLEAALQRQGRPSLAQVLRWMEQLLDALQHVHAHGIVHRNVKASNLLLTPAGNVKLSDFGIAHVDNAPRTQVGLMIGTPGCMAPVADATATRPAPPAVDATRLLARPPHPPAAAPSGACSAALLQRVETTLRSHVGLSPACW